jgi:hypothetical protein
MKQPIRDYKLFIDVPNPPPDDGGCTEHFWTERTFGGYKIVNIPFYATHLRYEDVVRADESTGEILGVVRQSQYRTGIIRYVKTSSETIAEVYQLLRKKFDTLGIVMEGGWTGVAAVAVPSKMAKKFLALVDKMPEITAGQLY